MIQERNRSFLEKILAGEANKFVFKTTTDKAQEYIYSGNIQIEFERQLEIIYKQIQKPRKIRKAVLNATKKSISPKEIAINTINSREYAILEGIESNSTQTKKYSEKTQNVIVLGSQSFYGTVRYILENKDYMKNINTIMLIESSSEQFNKLIALIDLQEIIDTFKDSDICLEIILSSDPNELKEGIYKYFCKSNPFILYSLGSVKGDNIEPELIEFEEWLFNETGIGYRYITNMGFTTDEVNQIINSCFTYATASNANNFSSLKSGKKGGLCVVTGSGPSIENNLNWLKENNEKVTILAAGSSIKILLDAGIKTHGLVMTERNSIIYEYIKPIVEEYKDLSNTVLICSDTVDPRIIKLFRTVYLFQRPLSAVSALFYEQRENSLLTSGPETINACIEVAIYSDYKEILLMGCDCGAKKRERPRAANAFGVSPREMNIPVRGNRGNTVYSQASLLLVRDQIERIIEVFPNIDIWRIGEGAYIKGEKYFNVDKYTFNEKAKTPNLLEDAQKIRNIDVDMKINNLRESCINYLRDIINTLKKNQTWNSRLEKEMASFMSVELNSLEEDKIDLAARRMLRQFIYNAMHNYYISFENKEEQEIAVNELVKQLKEVQKVIDYILNSVQKELKNINGDINGWKPEKLKMSIEND